MTHRSWLTRSEVRKVWLYVGFTIIVTLGSISVKMATSTYQYPLLKCSLFWLARCDALLIFLTDMTMKDVILASLFFQFALYVMVRLARKGFTMGELGLVAQGATAIFLEAVNFAVAKVFYPESTALSHIPLTNPAPHFPTCPFARCPAYWIPPFPAPLSFSAYGHTPVPSSRPIQRPAMASGEQCPAEVPSAGFLHLCCTHCRWTHWAVRSLVTWQTEPLDVGNILVD